VLAEHPWTNCGRSKCPLIISMRVGRGRLLMLPFQGLWRWQLSRKQDDTFDTFWGNTISALLEPEETRPVRLSIPKRYFPIGKDACFEARIEAGAAAAKPPIAVISPSGKGKPITVPMRLNNGSKEFYTACFYPTEAGIYTVEALAGNESSGAEPFAVEYAREEVLLSSLNSGFLKNLSEKTGGIFVEEKQLDKLIKKLNTPGKFLTERAEFNLWRTPWCWFALGFIILVLSIEWIVRRRGGLT
jgi:hypothetical protein